MTCVQGVLTEPVEWTGMVRAELDIMSTGRVSAICGLPPSFLPLRRILCILSMITTRDHPTIIRRVQTVDPSLCGGMNGCVIDHVLHRTRM